MPIEAPPEVIAALSALDSRTDIFTARIVESAILETVKDGSSISPEKRRGGWAEWAAFALQTREAANGGPWGTHFQPLTSGNKSDGTSWYVPDLREADAESVVFWAERATAAKHPVLVARYADLVWDATEFVTKVKRGRDKFQFVQLAIDAYIAAARLDDGSARGDTRDNLGRALQLAISVKDTARASAAVAANIDYVERTSDDEKIGTYCYLFDRLLPAERAPELTEAQESALLEKFEAKFAAMIAPGSRWYADPHGPESVGILLGGYYQRKGRAADRTRIYRGIAETFERRARTADALTAVNILDVARRLFLDAGLREDAERVQREAQLLGPEAAKCMSPITAESKVKSEDLEKFLAGMMEGGLEPAIERFAIRFVPRQSDIQKWLEEKDSQFIAHKLFPLTKMAHGHIVARVGDDTADLDGKMVHETAEHMQYAAQWIGWTLSRMIRDGLSTTHAMDFIRQTPIFEKDRLPLVQRGVEAHLRGDYVQAIHVLIPQIEHAARTLVYFMGRASNKPHRTGRGVMQFKNLNDLLSKEQWPVPGDHGENLRMYLLATLAHAKGENIRNDVAHGLWPEEAFHTAVSERILHVLFAMASIRLQRKSKMEDSEGASHGTAVGEAES